MGRKNDQRNHLRLALGWLLFPVLPWLLLGCCKTEYVMVPCPPPKALERPVLAAIAETAEPSEQVRGMAVVIQQLESYAGQLEALLEGYR